MDNTILNNQFKINLKIKILVRKLKIIKMVIRSILMKRKIILIFIKKINKN